MKLKLRNEIRAEHAPEPGGKRAASPSGSTDGPIDQRLRHAVSAIGMGADERLHEVQLRHGADPEVVLVSGLLHTRGHGRLKRVDLVRWQEFARVLNGPDATVDTLVAD